MKSIRNITRAAAIISVFAFHSCERRSLEDFDMEYAIIPVHIDWSVSGVAVEEMHRASVWLFPIDGAMPMEYRLEGNLVSREINVPVGVYSVLVFNETIDENDWNGIAFTGTESFQNFAARSITKEEIGFYERSDDLPLVENPEAIAAWSIDQFEVTPEMVSRTRTLLKNKTDLETEVPHLTAVQPTPRFERVVVTAYVQNLSNAKQATGTINGMTAGVYMVSGERIPEPSAHAFILNGRVYDDNRKDGTTTRSFNIFGRANPKKHNLAIDFLLSDGTWHPSEEFDVTKLIVTEDIEHVRTNFIYLGYGNRPGDRPIILPEGEIDENGISVDQWDEVTIPLK